jgi:hypothetical protein
VLPMLPALAGATAAKALVCFLVLFYLLNPPPWGRESSVQRVFADQWIHGHFGDCMQGKVFFCTRSEKLFLVVAEAEASCAMELAQVRCVPVPANLPNTRYRPFHPISIQFISLNNIGVHSKH